MNTSAASDLAFLNSILATATWLQMCPPQAAFDLELQRELVEWELGLCYSPSPATARRAIESADVGAGAVNALNAVEV